MILNTEGGLILNNKIAKLDGSLPIYLSNQLIEAHFYLPLLEQRLLYSYISKITKKDISMPTITISIKDFSMLIGEEVNYDVVKKRSKKLLERVVEIKVSEKEWIAFQWFSKVHYCNGLLQIKIHEELNPYLLGLKKEFTRFLTSDVLKFKSVYSIRIYILSKQYKTFKKRLFTLDELKKKLGIYNKYTKYNDFKKRVLEIAVNEINEKSDLKLEYNEIKEGRKVSEIVFFIDEDSKDIDIYKKSHKELADILNIEIEKHWDVRLQLVTILKYSKETISELYCNIITGAYNGLNIKYPIQYFNKSLENIELNLQTDKENEEVT
jgi:plasmid replication initiation protein